ncbi:nucleoside-diphosphate kinase [Patescibacteria group bacterium]|nr:nucleoside-diphosphate kinase [Patescibacteria group bacterium]MDE2021365.1 nucleoside-diphosphate kinase [Patescibacteria group bacterium]
MFESTVVLIKPDGVLMGVGERIIERYLMSKLGLHKRRDIYFSLRQAETFYGEHAGRFYFPGLVLAMTSGPSIAMVLQGENAVARVRELNGATNPSKAVPGTIRHDFRSAGGPFNTVHGSDSVEAARREMDVVFWNLI